MSKKSKSTKQVRAIDRIIKFQIDDGIESLTISGYDIPNDSTENYKISIMGFIFVPKPVLIPSAQMQE